MTDHASPPATPSAGPIAAAQRITSLDAIRGIAILGILPMNALIFGLDNAAYNNLSADGLATFLDWVIGVLTLLFSQMFINVGMTMGLMPITGMTLPLVSYGGSSLVVNCIALGLLVNVGQRQPIQLNRRPFEHGRRREKPQGPEKPLARSLGR